MIHETYPIFLKILVSSFFTFYLVFKVGSWHQTPIYQQTGNTWTCGVHGLAILLPHIGERCFIIISFIVVMWELIDMTFPFCFYLLVIVQFEHSNSSLPSPDTNFRLTVITRCNVLIICLILSIWIAILLLTILIF